VREIGRQLLAEAPVVATTGYTRQQRSAIERGHRIFSSLCFACHGSDGEGAPMAVRPDQRLAPPLKGSLTAVQGDSLLRVLLHGLSGPVDGKTYESEMMSMGANSDSWIADIASYVRVSFGNKGTPVTADEVARLRAATIDRTKPWTIAELRAAYR
jgi:mono/diheme cytochrome c family protein